MHRSPETRPSLLLRLRDRRDHPAWNEFVAIYEPLIYRLARRKGFQDSDARELTQEVLLSVLRAIDRWDPDPARGSFRGWLFRIARNLMVNFLAQEKRHPRGVGHTDFNRLLAEQPAPDRAESDLFDEHYRQQVFRWASKQIRDDFREKTWLAFWKTCIDGDEIQTVATSLQMSVGSVYVSRSRVMARLRETIEAFNDE